jgi:hypothetical protein
MLAPERLLANSEAALKQRLSLGVATLVVVEIG